MAAPPINLKINFAPLSAAMRRFAVAANKDAAWVLNNSGYRIGLAASKLTEATSKSELNDEIGPTALRIIGHKVRYLKGRMKQGVRIGAGWKRGKEITEKVWQGAETGEAPRLVLIIQGLRKRMGKPGLRQDEMQAEMTRVYQARLNATGFLRLGWLFMVGDFAKALGKTVGGTIQRLTQRRKVSWGKPATPQVKTKAEFYYAFSPRTYSPAQHKYVLPLLQEGLAKAMAQQVGWLRKATLERLRRSTRDTFRRVAAR